MDRSGEAFEAVLRAEPIRCELMTSLTLRVSVSHALTRRVSEGSVEIRFEFPHSLTAFACACELQQDKRRERSSAYRHHRSM